jgi:phosphate-selective porin
LRLLSRLFALLPLLWGDAYPQSEKQSWASVSRSGLGLGSEDGPFEAEVHLRGQFRYSAPFQTAPRTPEHFLAPDGEEIEVRRARIKGRGRLFQSWTEFQFEHSLVENRSLDAKLTLSKLPWLKLSAGQWKVDYQREQIDSSGEQQFVERSIVNRAFTLNRQKGVQVHGRIGKDRPWDSQYWSGVFLGNGRGFLQSELTDQEHDDGSPLWASRYQWNAMNGGVDFSQSDIDRSPEPRLSLAVGAARNRSRYTRFSGSGGGQLDGFDPGRLGQYSVRQFLVESAYKRSGFSFQHESHWKRLHDNASGQTIRLRGSYAQAGYFLNGLWRRAPKPLEVAVKGAYLDPDAARPEDTLSQLGFAVNWFFEGHDNKLTLDVFRYGLERPGADLSEVQVRLQWDLTI